MTDSHPPTMHGHGRFRYCPNCAHEMAPKDVDGKMLPACANCGYILFLDPKVATGVLLGNEDGHVLFMQRAHEPRMGLWSFPSGFVDAGEKVEDAAVREVWEEALVEVRLDGLLGVYSEKGDRVILIAYHGAIVSGEPKPGPESQAVGYFHPNKLPDLAFPRDRYIIEDWQAALLKGALSFRWRHAY
jgi:8-oxo-dGTP diphosphatase